MDYFVKDKRSEHNEYMRKDLIEYTDTLRATLVLMGFEVSMTHPRSTKLDHKSGIRLSLPELSTQAGLYVGCNSELYNPHSRHDIPKEDLLKAVADLLEEYAYKENLRHQNTHE